MEIELNEKGYAKQIDFTKFKEETKAFNEAWRGLYEKVLPSVPLEVRAEIDKLCSIYCSLSNVATSGKDEKYKKGLAQLVEPQSEEDRRKLFSLFSLRNALDEMSPRK